MNFLIGFDKNVLDDALTIFSDKIISEANASNLDFDFEYIKLSENETNTKFDFLNNSKRIVVRKKQSDFESTISYFTVSLLEIDKFAHNISSLDLNLTRFIYCFESFTFLNGFSDQYIRSSKNYKFILKDFHNIFSKFDSLLAVKICNDLLIDKTIYSNTTLFSGYKLHCYLSNSKNYREGINFFLKLPTIVYNDAKDFNQLIY